MRGSVWRSAFGVRRSAFGGAVGSAFGVRRSAFGVRRCGRLAFGVWRLAFGVWRLAFCVWRLAFGVCVRRGCHVWHGCGCASGMAILEAPFFVDSVPQSFILTALFIYSRSMDMPRRTRGSASQPPNAKRQTPRYAYS